MDPYVKSRKVWICPSGPTSGGAFEVGPKTDRLQINLGYNEYLFWQPDSKNFWANQALLASSKAGVSGVAAIADSALGGIFHDWGNKDVSKPLPGEDPKFGMHRIKCANGYSTPGQCLKRHPDGGANVVFADSHASYIPGGRIVGGTDLPFERPVINPGKDPVQ
jgi:prepilin-type processing-associated H-X9-DG protein